MYSIAKMKTIKTKKIQPTIPETFTKKNWLRDLAGFHAPKVGDPRSFYNSFFIKNCYLNLNFFQELQSALLKNEQKSSQERCKPQNCWRHSISDKRKLFKKQKKKSTKNEKNLKTIFTQKTSHFVKKRIWKKLVHIVTFVFLVFSRDRLLEIQQQNTNAHIYICMFVYIYVYIYMYFYICMFFIYVCLYIWSFRCRAST